MTQQPMNCKAQPVMIFTDARLECCRCGALAIAVTMFKDAQSNRHLEAYCQDHFFYQNVPVPAPEKEQQNG